MTTTRRRLTEIIVFFSCLIIAFAACKNNAKFYNLGKGFKYGYFDTEKTLNVYYEDQGIVHGICHSVEWNNNYILIYYYPYDTAGNRLNEDKVILIEKNLYIKNPSQMESDAVTISDEDSIMNLLHKKQISLTNKKSIDP